MEARAPYATTATQLVLWKRMQQDHINHKMTATTTCNTSEPRGCADMALNKAHAASRSFQVRQGEKQIHSGNRKIVRSMEEIAHKPSSVARIQHSASPSNEAWKDQALSEDKTRHRMMKLKDVQTENSKLVGRILHKSPPSVTRREHDEHYKKHKELLRRIKKVQPPKADSWGGFAPAPPRPRPPPGATHNRTDRQSGRGPLGDKPPTRLPPVQKQMSVSTSAPALIGTRVATPGEFEEREGPCCPECGDAMIWSNYSEGLYREGWQCNNVGRCGCNSYNCGPYRFYCMHCSTDMCLTCHQDGHVDLSPSSPMTVNSVSREFHRTSSAWSLSRSRSGTPWNVNSRTSSRGQTSGSSELGYSDIVTGTTDTGALANITVSHVTDDTMFLLSPTSRRDSPWWRSDAGTLESLDLSINEWGHRGV